MRHERETHEELFAGLTASRLLVIIILVGMWTRLFFLLTSDFPLNDGGMFHSMVRDVLANHFRLPQSLSYNHMNIPFAYPPLAFYITAGISHVFNISVLTLLRYVPVFLTTACIPVVYLILRRLMKSQESALAATLIFSILPRSYSWLIMGGGLTRSMGFFFALITIHLFMRYLDTRSKNVLFLSAITMALTILSHLEFIVFVGYSLILFSLLAKRKIHNMIAASMIVFAGLALSSPWWVIVLLRHGPTVFISAFRAGFWSFQVLTHILFFTFTQEPILPIFAVLGLVGFWLYIVKKDITLPLWLTSILLLSHRSGQTMAMIPLAALAASTLLLTAKPLPTRNHRVALMTGLITLALVSHIFGLTAYQNSPLQALPKADRNAMQWIKTHTEPAAHFLLITPLDYAAWAQDNVSEWFPELTHRHSVTTLQGLEWLPNDLFMNRYVRSKQWKKCNDEEITCYESALKNDGMGFQYVYVTRSGYSSACCSLLVHSLKNGNAYKKIYDTQNISIWKHIDQKP